MTLDLIEIHYSTSVIINGTYLFIYIYFFSNIRNSERSLKIIKTVSYRPECFQWNFTKRTHKFSHINYVYTAWNYFSAWLYIGANEPMLIANMTMEFQHELNLMALSFVHSFSGNIDRLQTIFTFHHSQWWLWTVDPALNGKCFTKH